MKKRNWYIGAGLLAVVIGLGASQMWLQRELKGYDRGG